MTISDAIGSIRKTFDETQASGEAICKIGEKDISFVPKNKPGARRCEAYHVCTNAMITDYDE